MFCLHTNLTLYIIVASPKKRARAERGIPFYILQWNKKCCIGLLRLASCSLLIHTILRAIKLFKMRCRRGMLISIDDLAFWLWKSGAAGSIIQGDVVLVFVLSIPNLIWEEVVGGGSVCCCLYPGLAQFFGIMSHYVDLLPSFSAVRLSSWAFLWALARNKFYTWNGWRKCELHSLCSACWGLEHFPVLQKRPKVLHVFEEIGCQKAESKFTKQELYIMQITSGRQKLLV